VLVAVTAYLGIQLSTGLVVVLGVLETLVMVALGISGFASPGPGGVNLRWLSPHNAPSGHALFLGVVFGIFAMAGWDAAAPLGEESEDPKKTISRGVLGCIAILGLLLFFLSWAQSTGWGTNAIGKLAGSAELPAFVLGHRYWGGAWVIILIALLNSAVAVAIACMNTATRFLYGMARTGVLPRQLTRVHPRYRTPTGAIAVQTLLNVGLGILLPIGVGVANVYNITGTWFTFAAAPVYAAANVGLFFYVRRHAREQFNWLKHALVPLVGIVALAFVIYYSLNPLPLWPIDLAPLVVVCWFGLGLVLLTAIILGGKESLLAHAKDAAPDRLETAEEHAARLGFV
jgi:amino acid transporter